MPWLLIYGLGVFAMFTVMAVSPHCEHQTYLDRVVFTFGWPVAASFRIAEELAEPKTQRRYFVCWRTPTSSKGSWFRCSR